MTANYAFEQYVVRSISSDQFPKSQPFLSDGTLNTKTVPKNSLSYSMISKTSMLDKVSKRFLGFEHYNYVSLLLGKLFQTCWNVSV